MDSRGHSWITKRINTNKLGEPVDELTGTVGKNAAMAWKEVSYEISVTSTKQHTALNQKTEIATNGSQKEVYVKVALPRPVSLKFSIKS